MSTRDIEGQNQGVCIMYRMAPGLLAIIGFLVLCASSVAAVTLNFAPEAATFVGEEQQTLEVLIDTADGLLGASLTVAYDPTVVDLLGVTPGDVVVGASCSHFIDWEEDEAQAGMVVVDLAMFGCVMEGAGSLVNLTFAGVGPGTSSVTIADGELRDEFNEPVAFTAGGATLTYGLQTGVIEFTPTPAYIGEEGTAEVCLQLSDVVQFQGVSLEFGFDPDVAVPTTVMPGSLLTEAGCSFYLEWLNEGEALDTAAVDMALLGCQNTGDGELICLTFTGVAEGESPLTWVHLDIRDGENVSVPVEPVPGALYFDPAVPTRATSWTAVKALYRR